MFICGVKQQKRCGASVARVTFIQSQLDACENTNAKMIFKKKPHYLYLENSRIILPDMFQKRANCVRQILL